MKLKSLTALFFKRKEMSNIAQPECLFYHVNVNGSYVLRDTITGKSRTYYFATLKQAIQKHRKSNGLKGKHLKVMQIYK